ncbi:MAG: ATP-dependent zinc metalloprotease FtsH [Candidatus Cloacimonetes bacterium]|nr:ATP-dependent zinc metalloprotease FtsH [Candidatus Cloacimonadota bacterium]
MSTIPGRNKTTPPRKTAEGGSNWRRTGGTITFWLLIILIMFFLTRAFDTRDVEERLTYTEYRQLVTGEERLISKLEVVSDNLTPVLHGELLSPGIHETAVGSTTYTRFTVNMPPEIKDEMAAWDAQGIPYSFEKQDSNWIAYAATTILPWIVLFAVWIYIMRRMQGGGQKGVFSFGKSRAKMLAENSIKITFADVAGADEAKEELEEVIEFLRDPKKFSRLGGKIPKGALMLGPPGTGKTLLARAVAGEAGVPFFSMSGADFVEMFVGVGASRVRDLFEQGKKSAPCIIFIDEIDAVGRQRGAGLGGGHDEREQTLNQLLVEMDGFESNEGVILIAATNRPDVLDPALLRPGRFDRQIVVDRPDVRGREGILKVHSRNVPLNDDVDLKTIARGTPGLAGAELANLVNEAALLAARHGKQNVDSACFEEARDKVVMGTARKSLLLSDLDKRITAYHEAGHALLGKILEFADPVHKVTIIPRGRALGLTWSLPEDDLHETRSKLLARLRVLFAGRIAEELIFNEVTTGAASDIQRATEIAQAMVCDVGMSPTMGLRNYGKKQEEIFLGREISQHRDFSESTAERIDAEIDKILLAARQDTQKLLEQNLESLHRIAEALLVRELIDGDELDVLIRGDELPPLKKAPTHGDGNGNSETPSSTSGSVPAISQESPEA